MPTKAKTTTKLEYILRDLDERARCDAIVREFDDDDGVSLNNNSSTEANLLGVKDCALSRRRALDFLFEK